MLVVLLTTDKQPFKANFEFGFGRLFLRIEYEISAGKNAARTSSMSTQITFASLATTSGVVPSAAVIFALSIVPSIFNYLAPRLSQQEHQYINNVINDQAKASTRRSEVSYVQQSKSSNEQWNYEQGRSSTP